MLLLGNFLFNIFPNYDSKGNKVLVQILKGASEQGFLIFAPK